MTRRRRGWGRVSSGISIEVEEGGERTMQSSKDGDVVPSVKGVFGAGAEGCAAISPVGIEYESRVRY